MQLCEPTSETDGSECVKKKKSKKVKTGWMPEYTSFSHYSHFNNTPLGPFPSDLTFCQPILYKRHTLEETGG